MSLFERPRDPDEPVLYWTSRAPSASWTGFAVTALLSLPLAFLAPASALVCVALGALLALANHRAFRFELTPTHLRLRPGFLLPAVRIPLERIAGARPDFGKREPALDGTREGAVVLRLQGGRELHLGGLLEPAEAAAAIATVKRRGTSPSGHDGPVTAQAPRRAV